MWEEMQIGDMGGTPPLTNAWTPSDASYAIGVAVAVSVAWWKAGKQLYFRVLQLFIQLM